jgi:hypothetical protein
MPAVNPPITSRLTPTPRIAENGAAIVYDNLTFWGWAFLIWGALQILAGAVTLSHRTWGAALGVALAATSCVLWFFMIFVGRRAQDACGRARNRSVVRPSRASSNPPLTPGPAGARTWPV